MISGIQSAILKLNRASEHIDSIKAAVARYSANDPAAIATQPNGKTTIDFKVDPSSDISVLAGEVIYQIKSALDHLAFDLVKLNARSVQLPSNWESHCEFPLMLEIPTKGNPPVAMQTPLPYNYFSRSLPGISIPAFTFIEAVQPYYRLNTANVLRPIAQLSNIDKHRHLHVLDPQAYRISRLKTSAGNHLSVHRMARSTKLDPAFPQEWLQEKDAMYVETAGQAFVSFDEQVLDSGTATLPVDHLLELCVNELKTIIIPAFEKFIQNP